MRRTLLKGRQIPRVLFHWSPQRRRSSIKASGLRIRRFSTDRAWRPHYICLSDCPSRALMLCPHIPEGTLLDLYQVFPALNWKLYRLQRPRGSNLIPEWRVYHDISKRRTYRIATRRQTKRRIPTL